MEYDGTLIINNAEAIDSGQYTCIAENKLGMSDNVIQLNVGAPPQMIQIPKGMQLLSELSVIMDK